MKQSINLRAIAYSPTVPGYSFDLLASLRDGRIVIGEAI
jgi:hypothetical protein